MSELKLVSPLLDGFVMGDAISDHDGVRCCPAMRENSDEKYIVKVISVPASQRQLDALLLTGAYKDASAAAEYFKTLADDTVKEARLLQQLAKLEGFLSYEGWQIVPMDGNELGFDIYLLGTYKKSLDRFLRRNAMTHLSAVNLGIDLCAALSLCRRAGFIYTDLKPSNIFLSGQREYRIGDLGFTKLSAMKYTTLPTKYISRYTPPELHDAFATLNPTVDTYAVGMILYQIYNNGEIPFATKAPLKYLPTPLNADYEMAEIIQKACDPNPRKRYQTPVEMGQALVSYMQRNSVNDIPIVPPTVESVMAASAAAAAPEAPTAEPVAAKEPIPAEAAEPTPEQQPEELRFMEELVSDETAPDADAGDDLVSAQMSDEVDMMLAQADDLIFHQPDITTEPEEPEEPEVSEEVPEEEVPEEEFPDVSFEEAMEAVESEIADAADVDVAEESVSDNIAESSEDIEADETVDFTEEAETEEDDDAFLLSLSDIEMEQEQEDDDLDFGLSSEPVVPVLTLDPADDFFADTKPPRKKRGWIVLVVLLLIFGLLCGGGFYYYTNHYQLLIDNMTIDGFEDTLTISLTTDADETLLNVVCTDAYGNKQEQIPSGGKVVFSGLTPDTMYKIVVETDDFHKVIGSSSGNYTTVEETNILDFTAKAGLENGSVILNFTVEGPEAQDWNVEYTAEGEETKIASFTGHTATINELTVGKNYTFTLLPPASTELYLLGNTTVEFEATNIVVAKDLTIVSCNDGVLTAQWSAPEASANQAWTVRCYSENGYNETITVTETGAHFTNISTDASYTVEVTAVGMSQNARAFVTANPATVTDVQVSYTEGTGLTVNWKSEQSPEGGWLVMFRVDGSDTTEMAECTGNSAVVKYVIPNATYDFEIKAADASTVFGGTAHFDGIEATTFNKYSLSAKFIESSLCRTPDKEGWTHEDVEKSDYTTSFAGGESASLVLYTSSRFYLKDVDTAVTFVIRNEDGRVLPTLTRTITKPWKSLWPGIGKYCYLDVPVLPTVDGKYKLEVYFDGATVLTKDFSIITTNG